MAEASSEASSTASSTSEAAAPADSGSPFISDPGAFDEQAAGAGADQVAADQDAEAREAAFQIPEISEDQIRAILLNGGDALHATIGIGDNDWCATQKDLERIAGPATRIINRYDMARAIARYSDEAALALGMLLWAWRSMLERRAVLEGHGAAPAPRVAPAPPPPAPAPAPAPAGPSPGAPPPMTPAAAATLDNPPPPPPGDPGPPVRVDVAPGYVTMADRIRAARERTPVAQPQQAPTAAQ